MATDETELLKGCTVIFVLGGPGSGKGTVCTRLAKELGWAHYSAGDLLRAEVASGTELGVEINSFISVGKIVPPELLMGLIKAVLLRSRETHPVSLLDGFPRSLAQAEQFESLVVLPKAVLFLSCTKEIMLQRCLSRGEATGRADDKDRQALLTRYDQFVSETGKVLDQYRARGASIPFIEVDGTETQPVVYEKTLSSLLSVVSSSPSSPSL